MKSSIPDIIVAIGGLLCLAMLLIVLWHIPEKPFSIKSCDCAKICNSEFKCGLKECPTGRIK